VLREADLSLLATSQGVSLLEEIIFKINTRDLLTREISQMMVMPSLKTILAMVRTGTQEITPDLEGPEERRNTETDLHERMTETSEVKMTEDLLGRSTEKDLETTSEILVILMEMNYQEESLQPEDSAEVEESGEMIREVHQDSLVEDRVATHSWMINLGTSRRAYASDATRKAIFQGTVLACQAIQRTGFQDPEEEAHHPSDSTQMVTLQEENSEKKEVTEEILEEEASLPVPLNAITVEKGDNESLILAKPYIWLNF